MMILFQALLLAQAVTAGPAVSTTTPAASAAKEKLICHMEVTGETRIAQRVCHTKAEWEQIERQSEEDFGSNMNKQNNTGNTPE
jgi:hypothetical protein